MSEYMAARMDDQITGAQSENERLADRIAELEAECARLREERDALRDSLKRHQDGRCFANVHTRQVARAIEQEADAALRGKENT